MKRDIEMLDYLLIYDNGVFLRRKRAPENLRNDPKERENLTVDGFFGSAGRQYRNTKLLYDMINTVKREKEKNIRNVTLYVDSLVISKVKNDSSLTPEKRQELTDFLECCPQSQNIFYAKEKV